MTKNVYIKLKDGDKESELSLESVDNEHQLSLIDGVFKFFDIDVDFKELADIYIRSGKAYKEFFDSIDSEVDYINEKPKVNVEEYTEKLKEATKLESDKELVKDITETESKEVYKAELPQQDYYVTGIKYDPMNQPLYKCRYKCSCNREANHYIKIGTKTVRCWDCGKTLRVKPATANGEVKKGEEKSKYRDSNGNFYIAGNLEPEIITKDSMA